MRSKLTIVLILITGILDILFIAAQICVTEVNFTWSPWYDAQGMFIGMMLFLIHPVALVVKGVLLYINFPLNEMNYIGKILLSSIGSHFLVFFVFISFITQFENTTYFFTISNAVLTIAICIFVILFSILLVNLIKISYRIINKEYFIF